MQRPGLIILKRLQVHEQQGRKLNGRAAWLLGQHLQSWAALEHPIQIGDGNNSLSALGSDHRTSTAL